MNRITALRTKTFCHKKKIALRCCCVMEIVLTAKSSQAAKGEIERRSTRF